MSTKILVAIGLVFSLVMSTDAQITTFTDRASFEAMAPGLPLEDFEDISGPIGGVSLLGDIISSTSMDGPVLPGDIEEGIIITTADDGQDGLVALDPTLGLPGLVSNVMGPNAFSDSTLLMFDPPVDAVGLDLFSFANNPGTIDATFMNGDTPLETVNLIADQFGEFVGAITSGSDVITSVVFDNEMDAGLGNSNGELVDNLSWREAKGKKLLMGDVNCDGMVTLLDVAPFVELISTGGFNPKADFNGDGMITLLDIAGFVAALQGGG